MSSTLFLPFLLTHFLSLAGAGNGAGGRWETLQASIGITAMHMQLLHNDRVVVFDRTDFGLSNISLPAGRCRRDPQEAAVKLDCSAHSVEYDAAGNSLRPLTVLTDVWCSSGAAAPDGRLLQTGGFNDGDRRARAFAPCDDGSCDWEELAGAGESLAARRWYATNHILPDGRQVIVGGRRQFNYEFYPKNIGESEFGKVYDFPFLSETYDAGAENNLYPFVHLAPSGELFVFANNRAVLFDYEKGVVVRTYPPIPGGDPRNYPSTGSSVLLPIEGSGGEAEVLVCGGAPRGAYSRAVAGEFLPALRSCGRIRVTHPRPEWVVETMPVGRVMGDMVLLPNGEVLIINGAGAGTAGWEYGRDPVLTPVVYRPGGKVGSRFEIMGPTKTPRMYHSTAVLLRDGRVLVGGSNPHVGYEFGAGVLFPTELSLEAYSPPYLDAPVGARPKIEGPGPGKLTYAQKVGLGFALGGDVDVAAVAVTMVAPPFTTHSFSMSQRLLVLDAGKAVSIGKSVYRVEVTSPGTANLAPPGYYLLFMVYKGIPSEGIWVHLQ